LVHKLIAHVHSTGWIFNRIFVFLRVVLLKNTCGYLTVESGWAKFCVDCVGSGEVSHTWAAVCGGKVELCTTTSL